MASDTHSMNSKHSATAKKYRSCATLVARVVPMMEVNANEQSQKKIAGRSTPSKIPWDPSPTAVEFASLR